MSILQTAIAQNRDKFLLELSELSGKQLCDVYISMLKESGDAEAQVSASELLDRLPDELLVQVLASLEKDEIYDSIQMPKQKPVVLDEDTLPEPGELPGKGRGKSKAGSKTKMRYY